jgi:hypothetical protein
MSWLIVTLLMALNFAISWWNARQVGLAWYDSKAAGGWPHFLVWMVAVMSASGFTWVYMFLLAIGMMFIGKLDVELIDGFLSLGYIMVVPGIIVSGIAIMIHSWTTAYRERTIGNMGVAGWNTFANVYNVANAFRGMPRAFESVGKLFSGKNAKNGSSLLILLLAIMALFGGIVTTFAIARGAAKTSHEKFKNDFLREKRKRGQNEGFEIVEATN